jgi:hypothetical protein
MRSLTTATELETMTAGATSDLLRNHKTAQIPLKASGEKCRNTKEYIKGKTGGLPMYIIEVKCTGLEAI